MDNLLNDDISQDVEEYFQDRKAGGLETLLIAAGLLLYISISCWGMVRAGFRPCSAGDCTIFPAVLPEAPISKVYSR